MWAFVCPFQFLCNKGKKKKKKASSSGFSLNYIAWEKKGREARSGCESWKKDFPFFRDSVERWSQASPFSAQGFTKRQVDREGIQQKEHWEHLDMVSDDPGII